MKKQAYTMIAMVVLVSSLAVAAKAQTNGRIALIANIPFQFNVGNKTLPAGEYTVQSIGDESSNVVLRMQSRDGKQSMMLQMSTVEGRAKESAKLIFNRYGDHYFFAQAWVVGDNTGLQAPKTSAERAAERELAGIRAKTEAIGPAIQHIMSWAWIAWAVKQPPSSVAHLPRHGTA